MNFTISTPAEVTDLQALDELVFEYYGVVLRKLVACGGPSHLTPEDLMPSFRSNLQTYLPPTGRLTFVHDLGGKLVGACMLTKGHL